MKLEVGMLVRTQNGIIGKVYQICKDEKNDDGTKYNKLVLNANERLEIYDSDLIVKANHNIIDLIEEKDLVEIEYYSLRKNERVTRLFEVSFKKGIYINLSNAKCEFMLINGEFNEQDKELNPIIKSIVTKEQFESMQYEVK